MTSAVVQIFVVTFVFIKCYSIKALNSEHGMDLSQGQMDSRGGDGRRLHVQFLLVQELPAHRKSLLSRISAEGKPIN